MIRAISSLCLGSILLTTMALIAAVLSTRKRSSFPLLTPTGESYAKSPTRSIPASRFVQASDQLRSFRDVVQL